MLVGTAKPTRAPLKEWPDIRFWDSVTGAPVRHFGSDWPRAYTTGYPLSADGRTIAIGHTREERVDPG